MVALHPWVPLSFPRRIGTGTRRLTCLSRSSLGQLCSFWGSPLWFWGLWVACLFGGRQLIHCRRPLSESTWLLDFHSLIHHLSFQNGFCTCIDLRCAEQDTSIDRELCLGWRTFRALVGFNEASLLFDFYSVQQFLNHWQVLFCFENYFNDLNLKLDLIIRLILEFMKSKMVFVRKIQIVVDDQSWESTKWELEEA